MMMKISNQVSDLATDLKMNVGQNLVVEHERKPFLNRCLGGLPVVKCSRTLVHVPQVAHVPSLPLTSEKMSDLNNKQKYNFLEDSIPPFEKLFSPHRLMLGKFTTDVCLYQWKNKILGEKCKKIGEN